MPPVLTIAAPAAAPAKKPPLRVSFKTLWLVYAAVPLCAAVALADHWFMKGALKRMLPDDPEELRVITIFLVYPHIVASANSFVDGEYLSFYKRKLFQAAAVALLLGLLVPALFGSNVDALLFAGYTIYHVMAQQTGIATMMTGKPDAHFKRWKWLTILVSALIYVPVYSDMDLSALHIPLGAAGPRALICGAAAFLLLVLALFTAQVARRSQTQVGRRYVWSNFAMVAASAAFYAGGYPFFSILTPRLVHDLSGFAFYVTHDQNRNAAGYKNRLYRLFGFMRLPVYVLSPLLGIAIANGLMELNFLPFVEKMLTVLSYFHYYTEGFMWKRGSLHRQTLGAPRGTTPALPPAFIPAETR